MNRWVLLMRGINVGGHNVLPMKSLRSLIEQAGGVDVATVIQSVNAAFRHVDSDRRRLASSIRSAVAADFGFEPDVRLLTAEDLDAAIDGNPFPEETEDPKTVHLWFLSDAPVDPDLEALDAIRRDSERYELSGTVFYLHAPDGIARSKLAANVERYLGTSATARNWRTVTRIRDLVAGMPG